jgi:hypothetical protein|tara:strand:- start:13 stop:165 length:153 start_codon:yes stop_codon:yes gene_type:complete
MSAFAFSTFYGASVVVSSFFSSSTLGSSSLKALVSRAIVDILVLFSFSAF